MKAHFIYINCKDTLQAQTIGRALVKNRLAASANILPGISSVYSWKGEIVETQEVVLIAKAESGMLKLLVQKVKEMHSYEIPCVVALPIEDGNPEYLNWINESCG